MRCKSFVARERVSFDQTDVLATTRDATAFGQGSSCCSAQLTSPYDATADTRQPGPDGLSSANSGPSNCLSLVKLEGGPVNLIPFEKYMPDVS